MVSTGLSTFVFLLLVLILQQSTCLSTQVAATINGYTVKAGTPSADEKDILDAVPTPQEATSLKVWTRKTMMLRVTSMNQIVKEKDTLINEQVSKISSSSSIKCNGKLCSKGKRKMQVESDNINLGGNSHHHVKIQDLSSFVTLNADYHPPKSHPPKNN